MATTDEPRADSTESKLDQLRELRDEAEHAGTEKAIERQRQQGKLLARERLVELLDPGTFVELDRYVRHREPNFGMLERRPYGDAVVTGYGTVFGRKVFVFSQDFTIFGGSLSAVYAEIFWRNVQCSGVVPQLSLVMGPCAGGAVYSPAITDFVLMVEGSSYMFITGPDVVKTVTGEEVSFEELGGALTHATKSGVAHFTSPDEEACRQDARYLLSFLPQNNLEQPPYAGPSDPPGREAPELDSLVPDDPAKPYDIKRVVAL